ncbi:unnamed protein product, partial [Meganyctiphanes norvegica]
KTTSIRKSKLVEKKKKWKNKYRKKRIMDSNSSSGSSTPKSRGKKKKRRRHDNSCLESGNVPVIDLCEELHDDVENLASIDENTHVPPGDTAGTVVYSTESIFARNTTECEKKKITDLCFGASDTSDDGGVSENINLIIKGIYASDDKELANIAPIHAMSDTDDALDE